MLLVLKSGQDSGPELESRNKSGLRIPTTYTVLIFTVDELSETRKLSPIREQKRGRSR